MISGTIARRTRQALRDGFGQGAQAAPLDDRGYAADFLQNLLPAVAAADFEADLQAGDGNELDTKFRAVHSSSALAVNCFAPFRRQLADLGLCGLSGFTDLRFERKCPTGLRRGTPPNLDLVVSGPQGVVGVESKLTEHLAPHKARFAPAYTEEIRDWRRQQGYFAEMERLIAQPAAYRQLDAAQLIKHAFGLGHVFDGPQVTLLYLYWEPRNPDCDPVFHAHRQEIGDFAARVAGSVPAFRALSYSRLWSEWRGTAPGWLIRHLDQLEQRYLVAL